MPVSLPVLRFDLPEWQPRDFALLKKNEAKMAGILRNAGKGSDKFVEVCNRLERLASSRQAGMIPKIIKESVDVRALTHMFGQPVFYRLAGITKPMLDSLYTPSPRLGLISLFQMISVFFKYFDQIGEPEIFDQVCRILREELENQNGRNAGQEIATLIINRGRLFTINGPRNLVACAKNQGAELESVFKQLFLQNYHDTRFHKVCRYQYYLETVRQLAVGERHPVLIEVCKPEVYNAPYEKGRLLGHEILTILIERSSGQEVSDEWRAVILSIAGDPRVAEASPRFRKWWAILGVELQKKVMSWLSGFDLRLFLEALENFGVASGNRDLQRMFKARKVFLEGLHKQGLIGGSRLFVGGAPERYLLENYKKDELPEYAKVSDTYRSMIYLQIGHCHMVEGSHSFKLWLFPVLPSESKVMSYAKKSFSPRELSYGLENLYWQEVDYGAKKPVSIVHHPDLTWQAAAINFLQSEGVYPDIEKLLEPNTYYAYKRRYGILQSDGIYPNAAKILKPRSYNSSKSRYRR
ncbi:MAG: hypothetical protein JXR80_09305 [Deltaproteobacteria bacterium]|nr:hypothetical protein [Deltaproteobacteria bacterium]